MPPWRAPPWATSEPPAAEGRHALAEKDQGPTWDTSQLASGGRRSAAEAEEEEPTEEVPADDDSDAEGDKGGTRAGKKQKVGPSMAD